MKIYLKLILLIPFYGLANQCPVDKLVPFTWGNESSDLNVNITADNATVQDNTVSFKGDVNATRGQEIFNSDKLEYNRKTEQIKTSGRMTYGSPNFAISGDNSDYNIQKRTGVFTNVEYYLTNKNIIGEAKRLAVDQIANTEDLEGATYSTCPRLKKSWHIKAEELHLDHKKEVGVAKGAKFYIKDVPVLYLPYLSFPLSDRRKTGFLFPQASISNNRGADLTLPFYINISPNQDVTLYPRIMSKRGFLLGAEHRYLFSKLSGITSGTYVPDDKKDHTQRWSFKTLHKYKPTENIQIEALYQRVSDVNYIDDFNNTLDLTNTRFLESHLNMNYRVSSNYRVFAQLQSYQLADAGFTKADKPYNKLPKIVGEGEWVFNNNFTLGSRTELTNFSKDNAVSGLRFDQEVSLSYLLENSYAFINPKLTYRFTSYDLKDQDAGKESNIQRSIPILSVDTGLYFDRKINWFGKNSTQTLEPRLFYLRAPHKNQSDIPDFDTSEFDSSYSWLFLENRFNGRDRVGDANQLTTAVSTTITDDETGKEKARLAIGQIQYFQDRKVSLLNSVNTDSKSDVIAEGSISIGEHTQLRGLLHRNVNGNRTRKSIVGIRYNPAADKVINLSHLYDEDNYKQMDFSGVWRINDSWRAFWRWNYSIKYSKTIDLLTGLEYSDCCWAVRLAARQKRQSLIDSTNSNTNDLETSLYIEFVLNGLGTIGNSTGELLQEVIPGYTPLDEER